MPSFWRVVWRHCRTTERIKSQFSFIHARRRNTEDYSSVRFGRRSLVTDEHYAGRVEKIDSQVNINLSQSAMDGVCVN